MGDVADGIIDGSFDCITGEYLGEGPGYPRTSNSYTYNSKLYKDWIVNKRNPIHCKIQRYMHSNPIIKKQNLNKSGVITFLHNFYKSINVQKKRDKFWAHYKDIIGVYELEFKKYCREFK